MTVIDDIEPLTQNHLPEEIIDREDERQLLRDGLGSKNLHVHGPPGTGKTHLVQKQLRGLDGQTCYLSCIEYDTQYKALQKLLAGLTQEEVSSGYHTSELQRKLEQRTNAIDVTIVLDNLDFLLLNDGDNLLYYLARLENPPNITCITSNTGDLQEQLEPRTYSSLQPRRVEFEPYTGEEVYEILAKRAKQSLENRSVHRNALTYIASTTQNAGTALTWLRTAAQTAEDAVTENLIEEVREDAHQRYTETKLRRLSQHHKILYQAIVELSEEKGPILNTGDIYNRYGTVAGERDVETLSDRRISDFLKQLEHFNLVSAEYHYGGSEGKTREISLSSEF